MLLWPQRPALGRQREPPEPRTARTANRLNREPSEPKLLEPKPPKPNRGLRGECVGSVSQETRIKDCISYPQGRARQHIAFALVLGCIAAWLRRAISDGLRAQVYM